MATVTGRDRREAEVLERLWGWRTCDQCDGTIMLGEAALPSRDGAGRLCLACPEAPAKTCGSPARPSARGSVALS
jgi:hypothetical protein